LTEKFTLRQPRHCTKTLEFMACVSRYGT